MRYGPPHEGETEEEASKIRKVEFSEAYEKSEFCASCHQEEMEHVRGTPLEVIPPRVAEPMKLVNTKVQGLLQEDSGLEERGINSLFQSFLITVTYPLLYLYPTERNN
jgi:hypothetical protein